MSAADGGSGAQPRTSIGDVVRDLIHCDEWGKESKKLRTDHFSKLDVDLLLWPPDVFAIAAEILRRSGGYLTIANEWPPSHADFKKIFGPGTGGDPDCSSRDRLNEYAERLSTIGEEWREAAAGASLGAFAAEDGREALYQLASEHPFRQQKKAFERVPESVKTWWQALRDSQSVAISDLGMVAKDVSLDPTGPENVGEPAKWKQVNRLLVCLLAAADEASVGMGIRIYRQDSTSTSPGTRQHVCPLLLQAAGKLLARNLGAKEAHPATLCRRVMARRAVVLPKFRTPQEGMSIRSLSHHLCHLRANETRAQWNLLTQPTKTPGYEDGLNLLLVPWPPRITSIQFSVWDSGLGGDDFRRLSEPRYGFFKYVSNREYDAKLEDHIFDVLQAARNEVGQIDGVVLPELACSHDVLSKVAWRILCSDNERLSNGSSGDVGPLHMFIGGVLQESADPRHPSGKSRVGMPINTASVYLRYPSREADEEEPGTADASSSTWHRQQQPKHHRWHLNGSQIVQYGLGATLSSRRTWVEATHILPRKMQFSAIDGRIGLAVLVCEDLAQADPIGDLVRAVAPNLVIALLADGPQLGDRWSARYASTLADDPGCSVLSLTSKGMAKLSRPNGGVSRSNVVALWKDQSGKSREIELPDECDALVLSLHLTPGVEFTADGRKDGVQGGCSTEVTFGGVHGVSAPHSKRDHDGCEFGSVEVNRVRLQQANDLVEQAKMPLMDKDVVFREMPSVNGKDGEQVDPTVRKFVFGLRVAAGFADRQAIEDGIKSIDSHIARVKESQTEDGGPESAECKKVDKLLADLLREKTEQSARKSEAEYQCNRALDKLKKM